MLILVTQLLLSLFIFFNAIVYVPSFTIIVVVTVAITVVLVVAITVVLVVTLAVQRARTTYLPPRPRRGLMQPTGSVLGMDQGQTDYAKL